MTSPVELLMRRTLDNGWGVIAPALLSAHPTGGIFSKGFIVEDTTGHRAFLKALDYSAALLTEDLARTLQALTESFNFERDMLIAGRQKRLDRNVLAIADGTFRTDATPLGVVQYLIFELAAQQAGDNANRQTDPRSESRSDRRLQMFLPQGQAAIYRAKAFS